MENKEISKEKIASEEKIVSEKKFASEEKNILNDTTISKDTTALNDYLIIGEITGTHGVRGEVKVFPLTDDPGRFKFLREAFLSDKMGNILKKLNCTGAKSVKNMAVLAFKEVTDMNMAESLKGKYLSVSRKNAVKLPEDSYFICDLIGLDVFNTDDELLGQISDIISTGANDVYVIDRPGRKQLLLPSIKEVVKKVDVAGGKITVNILPGLEEIYN